MGLLVAGKNPAAAKTAERTNFVATAGQTTFTIPGGYQVGDIDVYLNGLRLADADDYAAVNGSTVVLTQAAVAGDYLSVVCFYAFQVTGHYTKNETDNRYLTASGVLPMSGYLKTPNYGVSSASDSSSASLEASPLLGEQGVGVKAFGRSVATTGGDVLYTSDSRGAGGRHRFGYWNGTSFTNTMTLDSSGRLTLPYQPAFQASSSASQLGNGAVIPFSIARLNVGSCFNTTNYRFTAPVNGSYWFHYHDNHSGSAGALYADFYKNGASIGYGRMYTQHTGTGWEELSGSIVIYLNVGDYMTVNLMTAHTADSGQYSSFAGALIG